jgi:hypothetical protein
MWLAQHDIAFRERNVSRDPEAAQDLIATGTFATPLLVVGEDQVLGFHPQALERVLLSCSRRTPASHE